MHRTLPALLVTTLVMFATTLAARQTAPRDTSTVKQIMLTMTIPASDAIFSAASEPPKNAKEWQELRKNALALVESGNLLMTNGRAKDNSTWMDMARALVTQAQTTQKAIDAKDGNALSQASDSLYTTCETCHERYLDK